MLAWAFALPVLVPRVGAVCAAHPNMNRWHLSTLSYNSRRPKEHALFPTRTVQPVECLTTAPGPPQPTTAAGSTDGAA